MKAGSHPIYAHCHAVRPARFPRLWGKVDLASGHHSCFSHAVRAEQSPKPGTSASEGPDPEGQCYAAKSPRIHASAFRLLLLCLAVLTAAALCAETPGADGSRVTFIKDFPNSQPDYYAVTVSRSGSAVYKTAPDDAQPLSLQLPPELVEEIFALAERLHWFRDAALESSRRVASMGQKTLLYENGSERYAVTYNHTEVPDALALMTLFEKLSQTEQHRLRLEYLQRFDRLGLMKALLQVEADLDRGRLLVPGELLPILEKVQKDRAVAHIAQARAAQIIAKIQSPQP